MTYDQMIASGAWSGKHLELRKRMASYHVDSVRLGSICWLTRSPSPNDSRLHRTSAEVLTAAQILALLGHARVAITSTDAQGKKLEKLDLNVTFADGRTIGVEAADVTTTAQGKHDSEVAALVAHIRDLLESDPSFATAFGNNHVTTFLAGPLLTDSRIKNQKEARKIRDEIETFIRARGHRANKRSGVPFSTLYPTLQRRGATWFSLPLAQPYFDTGDGGLNPARDVGPAVVLRVLDAHRRAARSYRKMPIWLMLLLTGRWELLRDTLGDVSALHPGIDPFDRCYVTDDTGRVIELLNT